ncbi:TetR family transcriptional regulator [Bosea sp. 117]|uniref:TetR/AcrR family transcriptional regulator n=1 Tax=Bosea sp. 117 TaxID=1125973 RepID=UPI000AF32A0C|nr:TetR family transcriptional regulator [Bosea sp. 117]
MDNVSRSERTRAAVIQAALAIISRNGPGALTLDAIARECGISKGGLMHQFRTKREVLKALLEHQCEHFEDFSRRYLEEHASESAQPHLAAEVATMREALSESHSLAYAILGVVAQDPGLLGTTREDDEAKVQAIRAEASDPELALLRWVAARGLLFSGLLGLCPLTRAERESLFDRLLDDSRWSATPNETSRPRKRTAARAG